MKCNNFCFYIVLLLCINCLIPVSVFAQKSSKRAQIDSVKQELKQIEFERILIQANLCKNKKDFEQAIELYHNALSINPLSALVNYELASIYKQKNKYQDALKYAQKAIKLNPSLLEYRYFLAELYDEKGEYIKQIEQLKYILRLQPQNIHLYYTIADIYSNYSEYDKSLQVLQQIQNVFGINEEIRYRRFQIYNKQNKHKQAEEIIQELLQLYPSKVDYVISAIQFYENNALYSDAIRLCNTYINVTNNPSEILYAKARIYAKLDNVDSLAVTLNDIFSTTYFNQNQKYDILNRLVLQNVQSKAIYEKRYEIVEKVYFYVPDNEVVNTILARYYLQNNNSQKALPHLYYAIKYEKSNSSLYTQIIELEIQNKQWDSVISVASAGIILFPNSADLYAALGQAYFQTKQYNKAIIALQEGIDVVLIKNQKRLFYILLGESLYAQKSVETANQCFDKALQIDSTNMHTICTYAYYAALQNNNVKTVELLNVCNRQCNSNECRYAKAFVLYKQEKYAEAIEMLQSIDISAYTDSYYELLGDVLFKNNNIDEAQKAWNKANEFGATIDIQRKKV
ncbi:MAG TPA: tetratricopeptide repeat protein, partial [Bacteroidales bacterium]|nr:tetratricopeptide repeat protein [Bacteroidales bacterium]